MTEGEWEEGERKQNKHTHSNLTDSHIRSHTLTHNKSNCHSTYIQISTHVHMCTRTYIYMYAKLNPTGHTPMVHVHVQTCCMPTRMHTHTHTHTVHQNTM